MVKMDMKLLVLILLGVLVFMSFVQGTQISNLEKTLEQGVSVASGQTSSGNANTYTKPTVTIPAMVGGC
jgi:hypothetical protein|tara:strand:- start:1225 stop:1431 length:207 start_codon:yes stop_codon:yes gene_type:complete